MLMSRLPDVAGRVKQLQHLFGKFYKSLKYSNLTPLAE
jgi:hypothetical protein